jgi:hypothetical protein
MIATREKVGLWAPGFFYNWPHRCAMAVVLLQMQSACRLGEDCVAIATPAIELTVRGSEGSILSEAEISIEYEGDGEQYVDESSPSPDQQHCSDLRETCDAIPVGHFAGHYDLTIRADGFSDGLIKVEVGGEVCDPETVPVDVTLLPS